MLKTCHCAMLSRPFPTFLLLGTADMPVPSAWVYNPAETKLAVMQANLPAWVRYPDFERVQWLNDLLDQLWPNAAAAAAGIVREQLTPQLQANKPAWIYEIGIQTFTLGDKPPRISAVKVQTQLHQCCFVRERDQFLSFPLSPVKGRKRQIAPLQ